MGLFHRHTKRFAKFCSSLPADHPNLYKVKCLLNVCPCGPKSVKDISKPTYFIFHFWFDARNQSKGFIISISLDTFYTYFDKYMGLPKLVQRLIPG